MAPIVREQMGHPVQRVRVQSELRRRGGALYGNGGGGVRRERNVFTLSLFDIWSCKLTLSPFTLPPLSAHSISVPCMPGPISYPKMPNAKFICLSHNSGLMFMSFVFPTNIVTW